MIREEQILANAECGPEVRHAVESHEQADYGRCQFEPSLQERHVEQGRPPAVIFS